VAGECLWSKAQRDASYSLAKYAVSRDARDYDSFLHSLADREGLGSWDWAVESDVLSWSDEMYRVFGLDRQAFEPSFALYWNA
jgi:hypothetical protein